MSLSVDRVLSKAKSHAKKGDIGTAEALYGTVLNKFPGNRRAQEGLAALKTKPVAGNPAKPAPEQINALITLYNQGRLETLVAHARTLIQQFPQAEVVYNLLGAANTGLRRLDDAEESYRRALQIQPYYAEAHNNLGGVLQAKGDLAKAIECYRRALEIEPKKAQRHNNLGLALQENGDLTAAAESYQRALRLQPNETEVHNNLGNTLQALGYPAAAIEHYKHALLLQPDYADAHNNLGLALQAVGKSTEAIDCYKQALRIQPTYAKAYNNLGNVLQEKGDPTAAVSSYRRALEIQPDDADTHYNLAGALSGIRDLPGAIESYGRALAIKPDYAAALAQKFYLKAQICDWKERDDDLAQLSRTNTDKEGVTPFSLLGLEDHPARHRQRAETYVRHKFRQHRLPAFVRPADKPARLRIGYFSADFHHHPMMYLMARLFERHDPDRFDIHAYYYGRTDDDMTSRVRAGVETFHDVQALSDREVAELARRDGLDIAVDLMGHTKYARTGIMAHGAAPLQVNYMGFPGTMGAPFMDYIIADPVLVPEQSQKFYAEKIIYMPHTYQVNDNTRALSDTCPSRADCGLPEDGFVFCCFNNNYKLGPREFDIWMRLLRTLEGSVLWLVRSNGWSDGNLRREAQARGIDPNRLVFADRVPMADHLARHRHGDLFLDTFAYNAHTTASDALWAGLPVVTKIGDGFAARVAASVLTTIGLPELITTNDQDYERLALALAQDPARLESLRVKLAHNRDTTPLFDTENFSRTLEHAYTRIYDRYFNGEDPDHLIVRDGATR